MQMTTNREKEMQMTEEFIDKNRELFDNIIADANCFKRLDFKTKEQICNALFAPDYTPIDVDGEVVLWNENDDDYIFTDKYIDMIKDVVEYHTS